MSALSAVAGWILSAPLLYAVMIQRPSGEGTAAVT